MFDRIIFKNQTGYGPLIDVGAVAEALLFYGHVSIIANSGTIKYLLTQIPPFVFLDLVHSKRITLFYVSDQVGIRTTERRDHLPLHDLVTFSSPQHTINKVPPEVFYERTQNRLASRQFAKAIQSIDHDLFDQRAVLSSFENFELLEPVVSSIIHTLAPQYKQPDNVRFRIERENQGFIVNTNINFPNLNTEYHYSVPKEHSSISPAYLLSLFQSTQEDLYFSARLDSEVAVSFLSRKIHSQSLNSILNRRFESEKQIKVFGDLTLESGHAIREFVNSGKVPFADVVRLLDKADKFRAWLEKQPPDASLVKNYYRAIIENSWVEKLPVKTTRWGIFTAAGIGIDLLGAGGIGTSIGVSLGAFDTFVLDKLIGGWKPHHFVEGELGKVFSKKATKDEHG